MTTTLAAALQAERVAVLYRRIVLLVGGQMVAGCFGQVIAGGSQRGGGALFVIVGLLVILAALLAGVMCAVTTFQLVREMGSPVPWLWALAIFVPCVSIVVLLVLSAQAQAWCKERGIQVGLLGPTKESIERLKRESSVDRIFE